MLPALSPTTWAAVDRATNFGLWLALFAILAPILGPRPYGLFSIVTVFTGISEWILIEGTAEALITVDELDPLHLATANLTSSGAALAFSLVVSALAPAIGMVFHDREITHLLWCVAPLPVLSALSAAPVAILRRSLKYKNLAIRNVLGLVIGGVLGIVLAVAGAGVWALAIQVLAQRLAEVTILWLSVPARLDFRWSRAHFRELSPVGMNVLVGRMMSVATTQVPRIVIGLILGPTDLGLFTLANRIVDIIVFTTVQPRTSVGRIELRDCQPGSAGFERIYARMTENVSLLSFAAFFGMAALTPTLFGMWLDHRWAGAVIPTQLLLMSALPVVFCYCIDAALLGGKQSKVFKGIAALQTVTTIVTVVCTARFGLDLICLGLAIRSWALLPLLLWFLWRACLIPVWTALRPALHALMGATIMAAILTLPVLRPVYSNQRLNFAVLVAAGMALYLAYLYSFARHQLRTLLGGFFSRGS